MNKFALILVILLFSFRPIGGQVYPYWFVNQGEIQCEDCAVGIARLGYYVDSAFSNAKKEAVMNYIRYKESKISGGQAFWNTEAGKYFLSTRFKEEFDTIKAINIHNNFKILDSMICKDFVAVLVSQKSDCNKNILNRIAFSNEKPVWLEKFPTDENYYYDIGCSQFYFYELSSWLMAEKQGRFGIAKQIGVSIKSIQKVDDIEGQEIQNDDYSVIVKNMEIVSRYLDNNNKIFYVLFRAPIKQ